jgi:sulfite exporter TauE/SafE
MTEVLQYAWLGFAGGALAFAHCLGMCGGFALHLSQGGTGGTGGGGRAALERQFLWHAGKTATYVLLGAAAGFVGGLAGSSGLAAAQRALACVAGAVMVLMGVRLTGLLPGWRGDAAVGGLFAGVFRQFFAQPTRPAAFALGLMTGLLPCPIVVGFLALSLQSGSVLSGMATMAAVGAGTVWALLLLGMTGHALRARTRRWGAVVGGIVLVLLGAVTLLRGTGAMHHLMGHHGGAVMQMEMTEHAGHSAD